MGRVEETSWGRQPCLWWPSSRPELKHELASGGLRRWPDSPFYQPHFPLHRFKSVVEKSIRKLKFFNLIIRSTCTKKVKRIINCEMIRNE